MSRLFIAGDTHGGMTCHHLANFKKQMGTEYKTLTKDDIMLILGDAGFVWDGSDTDAYWASIADGRPYTTVCVLGNHENYDMIEQLPTIDFCGGKAWRVSDSLIYLRGGRYTFAGHKCYVINGADSMDKAFRTEGKDWWPQECLSYQQMSDIIDDLYHDYEFDYVFSHCTSYEVKSIMWPGMHEASMMEKFLNEVYHKCNFQEAYFGHYHNTKSMGKYHCIYQDVIELKAT